jgi:antitoxin (DNA-binding transcriptional repressor) of toxin-antitoxin stability system
MKTLSVKEIRSQLSIALKDAEAGDITVITRHGNPVAILTPVQQTRPPFPDLSEFRASIKHRGKSLTQTLREMREEERA